MAKRLRQLLTDCHLRAAKPKTKPYRLADGGGLYLYIAPSGVKSWQFRYRHDGRPQTATLSKLSNTRGLAWARAEAERARDKAATGDHLTRAKAVAKATRRASSKNTFAEVAAGWIKQEARRSAWRPSHRARVKASLENHLAELDGLLIAEITAAIAMPHIRRVEEGTVDMGSKVRQRMRSIFDYAVEGGLIPGNPIPAARRGKAAAERAHLPAALARDAVGAILRAADSAAPSNGVRRAHLLAAFTAQRMSEIVGATWSEFDLKGAVWSIPRSRMKRRDAERGLHLVPIPARLLATMREWRRADDDTDGFVCPAARGEGSITREAVEKFYRVTLKLRNKHSPHSWRSVLSIWANDADEDSDAVEAQLDHVTGGKVKTAYERAQRLDRRTDLMSRHEDELVAARDGAKVLDLASQRKRKGGV